MRPIKFKEQNSIAAKNQPQYLELPMHRTDDRIISCWKLTWKEKLKMLFTGRIWVSLLQPRNEYITPTKLQIDSPFKRKI